MQPATKVVQFTSSYSSKENFYGKRKAGTETLVLELHGQTRQRTVCTYICPRYATIGRFW